MTNSRFKTTIIASLLAGCAVVLSGCAAPETREAAKPGLPDVTSYPSSKKDVVVKVPEGTFAFKNLAWSRDSLGPNLKGDVVNNTTKSWNEAVFEVTLYDSGGKKLNGGSRDGFIRVFGLEKGAIKPIGFGGTGKYFYGIQGSVASFSIRFASGEMPVHYVFVMIKPAESPSLTYIDDAITIAFAISKQRIGFSLRNRTDGPVKIDWNQVAYVDATGKSHKVVNSGAKLGDKAQGVTVVPPAARVEDSIFPSDYVYYSSSKPGGRADDPLLPEGQAAAGLKGRSISVFMPMEVNGAVKNYLFTFKIVDVQS